MPPIFFSEPGDLGIYDSDEEFQRDVEPAGLNEQSVAYDVEGRLLKLTPVGVKYGQFGGVDQRQAFIQIDPEPKPTHEAELAGILTEFLVAVKELAADAPRPELPELQRRAIAILKNGKSAPGTRDLPCSHFVPPIFVWDPDDLGVYDSEEDLQRELEPANLDGRIVGYDVDGRLLKLTPVGVKYGWFGGVDQHRAFIQIDPEPEPTHAAELAGILTDFLVRAKELPENAPPLELPELQRRAIAYLRRPTKPWWRWTLAGRPD